MSKMEDDVIRRVDSAKGLTQAELEAHGREGEKVIIELLQAVPGIRVRLATPTEDSGQKTNAPNKYSHSEIFGRSDLAIDAVGEINEKPAIAFQITVSNNKFARQKKMEELKERQFVRLPVMNATDTAIPRVLVFVDHEEMRRFLIDRNITRHPKITEQIKESILNSLRFDLMKTQNPKEQELINKLMVILG